jgi:hypothetical protein
MGLRCSTTGMINLVDCEVPAASLLGEEGMGLRVAFSTLDAGRIGIAAQAVGIARGAFEEALAYAKTRRAFGEPLASFQAIRFMLADMATEIDAARLLTLRAASLRDAGPGGDFAREASMAKLYAAEMCNRVAAKAVQIHGGYGYSAEYNVERYYRDARVTTIYEGTSEIQASFALKEMAKGALFAALEKTRESLESLGGKNAELIRLVCDGIGWINQSVPTLLGDPQYALLNAKRVSEMVIDVLVASEFLFQADLSEEKQLLAATFVHRRMLAVEMAARRIGSGDASRLKRYDRILGLA